MRKDAPVDEPVIAKGGGDHFLLWEWTTAGSGPEDVKLLVILPSTVATMVYFTRGVGGVTAMLFQVLRQGYNVLELRHCANPGSKAVNAGAGGT